MCVGVSVYVCISIGLCLIVRLLVCMHGSVSVDVQSRMFSVSGVSVCKYVYFSIGFGDCPCM